MRRVILYTVPLLLAGAATLGAVRWLGPNEVTPSNQPPTSAPAEGADPPKALAPCKVASLAAASAQQPEAWKLPADIAWLTPEDIQNHNKGIAPIEASPDAKPLGQHALIDALFAQNAQSCANDLSCQKTIEKILQDAFGLYASQGSFTIPLQKLPQEEDRARLLEELRPIGVVLLVSPGALSVYLGKDEKGAPVAFGGLEDASACSGTPKKPAVLGALHLKSGSPTLLSKVTELRIFAPRLPLSLLGVASLRSAAEATIPAGKDCKQPDGTSIFLSPDVPNPKQSLRFLVVTREHPGPVQLAVIGPDKKRMTPSLRVYGAGPFTYVGEIESPKAGTWRAAFGDGTKTVTCREFKVEKTVEKPKTADLTAPFWPTKRSWNEETEILYAGFVEALFSYPIEEDRTWGDLHSLLRDPEKNLLYNHFSRDEEKKIFLEPDCADLPVALRAYFAWKLSLPYGVRQCDRGKEGDPPDCEEEGLVATNTMPRASEEELAPASQPVDEEKAKKKQKDLEKRKDNINAFSRMAMLAMVAMNSGAGRTAPNDSETDYYPIPLTREALRPGTVFADPYGHIMIIAQWVPQTFDSYGILMGADAQPDGTVGRRRFWRGAFLFVSDTKSVGAGFKAYRPVYRKGEGLVATGNKRLSTSKEFVHFSEEQYQGTTDDFYDKMEMLANPRPLNPRDKMRSLIDALEEAVSRRVLAVQNGEDYIKEHPEVMVMPTGYAIFETSGPWEDFATPSRDMRLLIAIDTIEDFSASLKRRPERFGLTAGPDLDATIAKLEKELSAELTKRTFSYKRTDGSEWKLTLQDVVDRQTAFETGYNPNDCAEYRWGAKEGSDEYKTCTRRAPAEQVKLLQEYKSWFATRTRPPRR